MKKKGIIAKALVCLAVFSMLAVLTGCPEIIGGNGNPVAVITTTPGGTSIALGGTMTFGSSSSHDDDGIIQSYAWVIVKPSGAEEALGYTPSINGYEFTELGQYTVRLVVQDNAGNYGNASLTIIVFDPNTNAPTAVLTMPEGDIVAGNPVVFDGSGSVDDDGDALTYEWVVTYPDQTEILMAETGDTLTTEFLELGEFTVTLTVFDESKSDTAFHTFDVLAPEKTIIRVGFPTGETEGTRISVGGEYQLAPIFIPPVENPGDIEVQWVVDDTNVANIDEFRVLSGVGAGNTVIHVYGPDGPDDLFYEGGAFGLEVAAEAVFPWDVEDFASELNLVAGMRYKLDWNFDPPETTERMAEVRLVPEYADSGIIEITDATRGEILALAEGYAELELWVQDGDETNTEGMRITDLVCINVTPDQDQPAVVEYYLGLNAMKLGRFSQANGHFSAALVEDSAYLPALFGYTLTEIAGLMVDPDIVAFVEGVLGVDGYPETPEAVIDGFWMDVIPGERQVTDQWGDPVYDEFDEPVMEPYDRLFPAILGMSDLDGDRIIDIAERAEQITVNYLDAETSFNQLADGVVNGLNSRLAAAIAAIDILADEGTVFTFSWDQFGPRVDSFIHRSEWVDYDAVNDEDIYADYPVNVTIGAPELRMMSSVLLAIKSQALLAQAIDLNFDFGAWFDFVMTAINTTDPSTLTFPANPFDTFLRPRENAGLLQGDAQVEALAALNAFETGILGIRERPVLGNNFFIGPNNPFFPEPEDYTTPNFDLYEDAMIPGFNYILALLDQVRTSGGAATATPAVLPVGLNADLFTAMVHNEVTDPDTGEVYDELDVPLLLSAFDWYDDTVAINFETWNEAEIIGTIEAMYFNYYTEDPDNDGVPDNWPTTGSVDFHDYEIVDDPETTEVEEGTAFYLSIDALAFDFGALYRDPRGLIETIVDINAAGEPVLYTYDGTSFAAADTTDPLNYTYGDTTNGPSWYYLRVPDLTFGFLDASNLTTVDFDFLQAMIEGLLSQQLDSTLSDLLTIVRDDPVDGSPLSLYIRDAPQLAGEVFYDSGSDYSFVTWETESTWRVDTRTSMGSYWYGLGMYIGTGNSPVPVYADEFEAAPGDDDSNNARTWTLAFDAMPERHTLHVADDEDWFTFVAPAGNEYVVALYGILEDTNGDGEVNDDDNEKMADVYLYVYDDTLDLDNPIAENYATVWLQPEVETTYYVRLVVDGAGTGPYDIRIYENLDDEFEGDDEFGGIWLDFDNVEPYVRNFGAPGDEDWFSFWGDSESYYTFITTELVDGAAADTAIAIFSRQQMDDGQFDAPLASASFDSAGTSVYATLSFVPDAYDDYYVRVTSEADPPVFGEYQLEGIRSWLDDFEPNDDSSTAAAYTVGTDGNFGLNFHTDTDADWFVVWLEESIPYEISSYVFEEEPVDLVVNIYDTNATSLLQTIDNALVGGSEIGTFTPSLAGNYYIELIEKTGNIGSYEFDMYQQF